MRNDLPRMKTILRKIQYGETAASLLLDYDCDFTPGQFVMVWLPGVDEKPFSVSHHEPGKIEVTIKVLGPVSGQIIGLKEGDKVGVRGPYGHGYHSEGLAADGSDCAFVAGGVGLAAVAPLIEKFPNAPVLYGENNESLLMLTDRFPKMRVFTMDGSRGEKGFPTDALPAVLAERKPKVVFTCGPEIMMTKVAQICHERGVVAQVSLERYMKCALGVCGQCSMDGQRVCVDGPVFDAETLLKAKDFGFRKLDKSGTWIFQGKH